MTQGDVIRKMNNEQLAKTFKLCYVQNNVLYFTDDFEHQWGDDWDDAPYEYNAGEPYEWADDWTPEQNRKHGHAHIRYIAYVNGYGVCEPKDSYCNSPYSVEAINKGAAAWLYHETAGGLRAGATMEEAGKWLDVAGALWGELAIGGKKHESDT